jgi:hypothetical protein
VIHSHVSAAAPERWIQLDTSLNLNPAETMWVVRAPVCANPACTESVIVFVTHWLATGEQWTVTHDRQVRATLDFMSLEGAGPHLLVGDLNTYEGAPTSCAPLPNNAILPVLRAAGYADAWPAIHGAARAIRAWRTLNCAIFPSAILNAWFIGAAHWPDHDTPRQMPMILRVSVTAVCRIH